MRNANRPPLMLAPADRYATLGAFGRPVHHQHAQLRAMLLARRRKDLLADYFARSVQDGETGEIRWLSECEGEPPRFDQMSEARAQQARERLGRVQGKALLIDLGPCITSGSGERQYAPRRFECVMAGQGANECKTANAGGYRWQTDLLRIR